MHTNVATDMYFPFNQEDLAKLYNQSREDNPKTIVQSFTRPLFHAFLAAVRKGQFVVECEVVRYESVHNLSMAEWCRRYRVAEPLTGPNVALFFTYKAEIEAELARLFPTATIEYLSKEAHREYITTEETPHYKFSWSLETN